METSVKTIPHRKVRLQYFLVSWKNIQYLRFGIYRDCGISWLVEKTQCTTLIIQCSCH